MQKNNPTISIVIVHYKVKKELLECINSIYISKPRVGFEIIVVDNDEIKTIEDDLKKRFPKVVYIKNKNTGWGGGTNKGVGKSRGEYVYLLNPDTIFINNALDEIYKFAKDRNDVGIASSLLFNNDNKVYALQGTRLLNPINAVFSLSFINKFFPNNPISRKFWMRGWDKSRTLEVESATLSAALIKKEVLLNTGGFDENFFLYFEEYDLSRRIKRLGYKNFIVPTSKVIHIWEASAIKTGKTKEFMQSSRRYYFKKYYGSIIEGIVELVLGLNKKKLLLCLSIIGILSLGAFLRFSEIEKYAPFIGDQAWFYLSARDAILNGQIPLLGITSSHTWIHQGPLWTYLLMPTLSVSNFHPLSGIYLSGFIGLLTIIASYILGKEVISRLFGLIFALLIAVSPLVVYHSRFAYHTSPIPLVVIMLFYSMARWIKGDIKFFPVVLFSMSVLYNLELATVAFWPVIFFYLILGFFKKKSYFTELIDKKMIAISIVLLSFPMMPILIYDFQNGFAQTVVFAGWFIYKAFQAIGVIDRSVIDTSSTSSAFDFIINKYEVLTLPLGKIVAYFILFASLVMSIYLLKKRSFISPHGVVVSLTLLSLFAYLMSGVPSEAYLVMLFPGLIYFFSILVYYLKNKYIIIAILVFISVVNISYLLSTNYLTKNTVKLRDKIQASKEIVSSSGEMGYILNYRGPGEEFESSVMPYEYLVWWLGHKQYRLGNNLVIIEESNSDIDIKYLPQ